jgi:hypothetical protein
MGFFIFLPFRICCNLFGFLEGMLRNLAALVPQICELPTWCPYFLVNMLLTTPRNVSNVSVDTLSGMSAYAYIYIYRTLLSISFCFNKFANMLNDSGAAVPFILLLVYNAYTYQSFVLPSRITCVYTHVCTCL